MEAIRLFKMKKTELLKQIGSGESEAVEFKEKFDKEALETVCAFANTGGGVIFLGVDDRGKIKGITLGKNTINEWLNQIKQSFSASLVTSIQTETIDGKTVVSIEIQENSVKPVNFKGRYFKRTGNSNRQMSSEEISQFYLASIGKSWDAFPEEEASLEELDLEKVKLFTKLANENRGRKLSQAEDPLEILRKLRLIIDSKPTKAAILLFGKDPQRFHLQAKIKAGRFKTETTIIDSRDIAGNIIGQVEEAMEFIEKNIKVEFKITGRPRRKEIWEYPLDALREAIINAVCHRDYADSAETQIRIYDDHILIWNPGKLPQDLTVEMLKKVHQSRPRNKLIASIFYDIGFIEQWGSGTLRIIDEFQKSGLPQPEFEEKAGMFSITFRKDILTDVHLQGLGLNERQIKAVMYVKKRGKITNREYQELSGVKKRQASDDLKGLENNEILLRVGLTGKGTYYILKGCQRGERGAKGVPKGH